MTEIGGGLCNAAKQTADQCGERVGQYNIEAVKLVPNKASCLGYIHRPCKYQYGKRCSDLQVLQALAEHFLQST